MISRRTMLVGGAGAAAAVLMTSAAAQQAYPSQKITVVVPVAAGSPYEMILRFVTEELSKRLGQPVIVEYKPGAGGTIGANYVRNAKPDGYTLLYSSVLGLHPVFLKNNPVDAVKDLSPISAAAVTPYVVVAASKFNSVQDIIAYGKKNPGQLKFGSSTGASILANTLIQKSLGVSGDVINYKGGGEVIVAIAGGQIDIGLSTAPTVAALIEAKKLNPIMITDTSRLPTLPQVPSATDLGYPELTSIGFTQGFWGPPKMPQEIANRLSREIAMILKTPEAVKRLGSSIGGTLLGTTPEEQLRLWQREIEVNIEAAKLINFQPQ